MIFFVNKGLVKSEPQNGESDQVMLLAFAVVALEIGADFSAKPRRALRDISTAEAAKYLQVQPNGALQLEMKAAYGAPIDLTLKPLADQPGIYTVQAYVPLESFDRRVPAVLEAIVELAEGAGLGLTS